MAGILETLHLLILCGFGLLALLLVLLALPNSRLKEIVMPIVAGCFAVFCGIYVLSPIDFIPELVAGPFGLFDDAVAIVGGLMAAKAALSLPKSTQR
jgi:uncharacterized membrane protein YkvA (DUF1232 family)